MFPYTPLSTLTPNKHSGTVASHHDTGGPRNTYIREDLKLCTHGSPQDRPAYSTNVSVGLPLCTLCWMHPCDGTVDGVPIACCGLYIIQDTAVWQEKCFYLPVKPSGKNKPAYFHMLYIPSDLWNDMSSFIIHIGSGVITISPIRLATDTINIMKSQFAQGVATAAKSGHNWLVSAGAQYTGGKR